MDLRRRDKGSKLSLQWYTVGVPVLEKVRGLL